MLNTPAPTLRVSRAFFKPSNLALNTKITGRRFEDPNVERCQLSMEFNEHGIYCHCFTILKLGPIVHSNRYLVAAASEVSFKSGHQRHLLRNALVNILSDEQT